MEPQGTGTRRAIPDRELLAELGHQLDGRRIVGLRRRPYRYATSAPLEEVTVAVEGGEEVALILKDLSRDRLIGDARTAKPKFLHEPRRELETYRRILAPAAIGPRCHAAVARPGAAGCWLLLEKVPGVELWQMGELAVWERVARWLGEFHGGFAGRLDELRAANPHLLEHTADWFRSWGERAIAALAGSADQRGRALAAALRRYGEVVDPLAGLLRTFVHGELYPSNVLVRRERRPGVYPVDWEMAAVGPGAIDLAALVGGWGPDQRQSLALAYLEGLGAAGGRAPELEELMTDLSRCRLALALQWLGWSSDWLPPREHAHDWLGEALALVGELGLA
ncbi:MAG: phosphotransferase [Solirubrobacterales bacterium]|nr:phosphotransferase [Solirubrobacterales bacterium]